jgi:hypothetical protein
MQQPFGHRHGLRHFIDAINDEDRAAASKVVVTGYAGCALRQNGSLVADDSRESAEVTTVGSQSEKLTTFIDSARYT